MPPRVSSYMSSPVITALPTDSLTYVRNLMLRHKIGRVVIVEDDKVVGIISKTDFVKVLYNRKRYIKPLDTISSSEIMTSPVYAVSPDRSVKSVAQILIKYNIGSLPVISNDGNLVGIITKTDLLKAYSEKLRGKFKVREIMVTNPPVVNPTHCIYYVIDLLTESDVKKVVVVEGSRPVGIITKTDISFLYLSRYLRMPMKRDMRSLSIEALDLMKYHAVLVASDIMTPEPLTILPDEDLSRAADAMVKNKISSLPVVNSKGDLIGIVTKNDIIKLMRKL